MRTPLHRKQDTLNDIRAALEAAELLTPVDADLLVFHLGDLWDATVRLPAHITDLREALSRLSSSRNESRCELALMRCGYLGSELEHLLYHIDGHFRDNMGVELEADGAIPVMQRLCQKLGRAPACRSESRIIPRNRYELPGMLEAIEELQLLSRDDAESLIVHLGCAWDSAGHLPDRIEAVHEELSQSDELARKTRPGLRELLRELRVLKRCAQKAKTNNGRLWNSLLKIAPKG